MLIIKDASYILKNEYGIVLVQEVNGCMQRNKNILAWGAQRFQIGVQGDYTLQLQVEGDFNSGYREITAQGRGTERLQLGV